MPPTVEAIAPTNPKPDGARQEGASKAATAAVGGATASSRSAAVTELEQRESISSPHELTDWVDSLIDSLQTKFDAMGRGMDQRMSEISRRIDLLENSMEELIQGHVFNASAGTAPNHAAGGQQGSQAKQRRNNGSSSSSSIEATTQQQPT
ncbi:unnamed protein product [Parajaminaea phylloscopi]